MPFLILFYALLALVTAQINTAISNGTCYYAPQQKAPAQFIPCGNVAAGHISCCQGGDHCESSNACWDPDSQPTYLLGCTDPNYLHSSCPKKAQYSDHVVVGLTNFGGPFWYACNDSENYITSYAQSTCPQSTEVPPPPYIFSDAPYLQWRAQLPASTGMSISWQIQQSQTILPGSTASSTAASTTTGLTTTSSPSSSSSSPSRTTTSLTGTATTLPSQSSTASEKATATAVSSSLTTGAKAGIGVGAFAGVLAIGALIWTLVLCTRRRGRNRDSVPPTDDQIRRRSHFEEADSPAESTFYGQDLRSPAWSGHKSELSADGVGVVSPTPPYHEFGNPQTSVNSANSRQRYQMATNPERHQRVPQHGVHPAMDPHGYQQATDPAGYQQVLSHGMRELPISPARQGFHEMPG